MLPRALAFVWHDGPGDPGVMPLNPVCRGPASVVPGAHGCSWVGDQPWGAAGLSLLSPARPFHPVLRGGGVSVPLQYTWEV